MVGDGRRGGRDSNGGAGGRGNHVERGSSSKQARNGKGRHGAGMSGYAGTSELDEAIQGMLHEYDGILKESPAFIKPLFEGTLHKHEAVIKGMMEKHKPAIMAILESKGMPEDEYLATMEHTLDEFEVAISKHLSKKYLLSLMCKTVAEQMKEAIMRMFRGRTH